MHEFNYIIPPLGVYILTTDDELISASDWKSYYDPVGIYVGVSNNINLPHTKYVLAPETISWNNNSDGSLNVKNLETYNQGIYNIAKELYNVSSINYYTEVTYKYGLANTKYFYENHNYFSKIWNYQFKNNAQAYVPAPFENALIIGPRISEIRSAYQAIGSSFKYSYSSFTNEFDFRITESLMGNEPLISSCPINSLNNTCWVYGIGSYWEDGDAYDPDYAYGAYYGGIIPFSLYQ